MEGFLIVYFFIFFFYPVFRHALVMLSLEKDAIETLDDEIVPQNFLLKSQPSGTILFCTHLRANGLR